MYRVQLVSYGMCRVQLVSYGMFSFSGTDKVNAN